MLFRKTFHGSFLFFEPPGRNLNNLNKGLGIATASHCVLWHPAAYYTASRRILWPPILYHRIQGMRGSRRRCVGPDCNAPARTSPPLSFLPYTLSCQGTPTAAAATDPTTRARSHWLAGSAFWASRGQTWFAFKGFRYTKSKCKHFHK